MPDQGTAPNKQFVRTDGTRTGSSVWQSARDALVKIRALAHDTHDQDVVNGLNNRLMRDGGNLPTADIPFNSNTLTSIRAAASRGEPARIDEVQDSAAIWGGTAGGTADALTISVTPSLTGGYSAGHTFLFVAASNNTGAATLNVDSQGDASIKKGGTTDVEAGDIRANHLIIVTHDGSNFQLVNQFPLNATRTAAGLVEEATEAEFRAATNEKFLDAGHLSSAAALAGELSDAATISVDWTAFINDSVTISDDRTLGNPSNVIAGQTRTIVIAGNSGTERELSFDTNYVGVGTLTGITSSRRVLVSLFAETASRIWVSYRFEDDT